MAITFGRKFMGMVIALVLIMVVFLLTLFRVPGAITQGTVMFTIGMLVTVVFSYIGGNIWSKWTTSKYFQSGLTNGGNISAP